MSQNALIKKTADFLQQPKQVKFLASLLSSSEPEAGRVVKTAIIQIMQNPKLANCDPLSVFRSVAQAAQLGLELGREAYLVPFKGQCTMLSDYKGLMRLVTGPEVSKVRGAVVYTADQFSYVREPLNLYHEPLLSDDNGEFRLAYAVAYDHNARQIEASVILASEMAKFRARSRSDAWIDWEDQMRIKTPIKRCCKYLPLSSKARRLLEIESNLERDNPIFVDPEIDNLDRMIEAPTLEAGSHKLNTIEAGADNPNPNSQKKAPDNGPAKSAPAAKPTKSKPRQNGKSGRACGLCGEPGHNARTCPEREAEKDAGTQAGEKTETTDQRLEDARKVVEETREQIQNGDFCACDPKEIVRLEGATICHKCGRPYEGLGDPEILDGPPPHTDQDFGF